MNTETFVTLELKWGWTNCLDSWIIRDDYINKHQNFQKMKLRRAKKTEGESELNIHNWYVIWKILCGRMNFIFDNSRENTFSYKIFIYVWGATVGRRSKLIVRRSALVNQIIKKFISNLSSKTKDKTHFT